MANAETALTTDKHNVVDAMRGVAALMVVFYHARAEYWTGMSASWTTHGFTISPGVLAGYASYPLSYGWLGVQIFFVLSGYCIHRRFALVLAACGNASVDWRRFFLRRLVRIYPVYLGALVLTAIVDSQYLRQGGAFHIGEVSWTAFLANVFALQCIASRTFGSNTVFWTLSIEIHLYLFYPLLFIVGRRTGALNALALAFTISTVYVALYYVFDWSQYFPYGHGGGPIFLPFVFMWTAGAYLADIEAGRAPRLAGPLWQLAWILALAAGLAVHMVVGEVASALPLAVGATGLVLFAMQLPRRRPALIGWMLPPLIWLGMISYSLYATHRVVFGMINILGFEGQTASVLKFLVATSFSVLFARLFYLLVEHTSLGLAARLGRGGPAITSRATAAPPWRRT